MKKFIPKLKIHLMEDGKKALIWSAKKEYYYKMKVIGRKLIVNNKLMNNKKYWGKIVKFRLKLT